MKDFHLLSCKEWASVKSVMKGLQNKMSLLGQIQGPPASFLISQ